MNQKERKNNYEDEVMEIDLLEIFYLFRRNFLFLVIAAFVGALIVGGCSVLLITPKYEATAKIYAVSSSSGSVVNLQDLQIGTQLTADYKELILSRPVMESVIKNLNLDYTVKSLKKMMEVSNPSNTRILAVKVTSTSPEEAAAIANEVANIAIEWLPAVMECPAPHLAEDATVPIAKSAPSNAKNAVIGAVAFAAVLFAVLVVRFLLDDTVHDADDLEKYFGIMPLSVIPQENEVDDEEDDKQARALRRKISQKNTEQKKKGGKH